MTASWLLNRFFGGKGWQLPGGGVKQGETFMQAAVREVHEEVGIDSDNTVLLCRAQTYKEHGISLQYELYVCTTSSDMQVTSNGEIYRYTWLPLHTTHGLSNHVRTALAMYEQGSDLLQ